MDDKSFKVNAVDVSKYGSMDGFNSSSDFNAPNFEVLSGFQLNLSVMFYGVEKENNTKFPVTQSFAKNKVNFNMRNNTKRKVFPFKPVIRPLSSSSALLLSVSSQSGPTTTHHISNVVRRRVRQTSLH